MKANLLILCCILTHFLSAQCTITSKIGANGIVSKTTDSKVFYYTERYTIYSRVTYDGIDYYVVLIIKPVSGKKEVEKVLTMELSNSTEINLDFYDSYATEKDTSLSVLFKINKEQLQLLHKNDVKGIILITEGEDKNFRLIKHTSLLRDQIDCIMQDSKKKEEQK